MPDLILHSLPLASAEVDPILGALVNEQAAGLGQDLLMVTRRRAVAQ
jgi:hypothetical protein